MTMNQDDIDAGTLAALMMRFREYRLPRAQRLLAHVRSGEPLTDYDIRFLEQVHSDCQAWRPLLERHPEYGRLVGRFVDLYAEIISRGLENERS
jgi:hypothetical protein